MNVFMTGASGYIGGSVAAALLASGHQVVGLVRSDQRASEVRERGIVPVLGTLSDIRVLVQMTREADAVISTANADDRKSVEAMLSALVGSGKPFVQTSGSSIVADMAAGERGDSIYEDDTPIHPLPGRAGRVAINNLVLSTARNSVRAVVVCPTLIYGRGHGVNPYSIQIPKMIALAKRHGVAKHVGRGENIWSNVHIDDLVDLYLLVLDRAPAGAFYYAENGENSMREAAETISRMLGLGGRTEPMSVDEAAAEWGESAVNYSFGSNSRVRATRARRELGWSPTRPALLDDIERGSYGETRT